MSSRIRQVVFILENRLIYKFDVNSNVNMKSLRKMISAGANISNKEFKFMNGNKDISYQDSSTLDELYPQQDVIEINVNSIKKKEQDKTTLNVKQLLYCDYHQYKFPYFFCYDCNQSICSSCVNGDDHKNHNFIDKHDYLQNSEILVSTIFKDISDLSTELTISKKNELLNLKKRITEVLFPNLHKQLNKIEEKLVEAIDFLLNQIDKNRIVLNGNVELLKSLCADGLEELKYQLKIQDIMIDEEIFITIDEKIKEIALEKDKINNDRKKFQEILNSAAMIESAIDTTYLDITQIFEKKLQNIFYKDFQEKIESINLTLAQNDISSLLFSDFKRRTASSFKEPQTASIFKFSNFSSDKKEESIYYSKEPKTNLLNAFSQNDIVKKDENILTENKKSMIQQIFSEKKNQNDILSKTILSSSNKLISNEGSIISSPESSLNNLNSQNVSASKDPNENAKQKNFTFRTNDDKSEFNPKTPVKKNEVNESNKPQENSLMNNNLDSSKLKNGLENSQLNNNLDSSKFKNAQNTQDQSKNKAIIEINNEVPDQSEAVPNNPSNDIDMKLTSKELNLFEKTPQNKDFKLGNYSTAYNSRSKNTNLNNFDSQDLDSIIERTIITRKEEILQNQLNETMIFSGKDSDLYIYKEKEQSTITKADLEFPDILKTNIFPISCSSVNYDKRLFVSGGLINGSPSKIFFCYDPKIDRSLRLSDMNNERVNHSSIQNQGFIFIVGGTNDNSVEKYSFDEQRWISLSKLNSKRANSVLVINNDYLYAFFGADENGKYLDSAERLNYNVPMSKWENVRFENKDKLNLKMIGAGVLKKGINEVIMIGGQFQDKSLSKSVLIYNFDNNTIVKELVELEEGIMFTDTNLNEVSKEKYGHFTQDNSFFKFDLNQ